MHEIQNRVMMIISLTWSIFELQLIYFHTPLNVHFPLGVQIILICINLFLAEVSHKWKLFLADPMVMGLEWSRKS